MTIVAIPEWNAQDVLPPIHTINPTSIDRSPYHVSLTDIVLRFGTSHVRHSILSGFLTFRAALHSIGLTEGFQWIDGSFIEKIEGDPHDVDVVTFFYQPVGINPEELVTVNPQLFNRDYTKADYNVDAFFVQLNSEDPELLVRQATYWYSLWSHRRDGLWKGYLQIDLHAEQDAEAKEHLNKMNTQGGQL